MLLPKVKGGLEAWVTAGSNALYKATDGWAYICSVKVGSPLQGLLLMTKTGQKSYVFQTSFVAGGISYIVQKS